jgi:tRNA 2-thiouridine synthesizing protein A
MKEEDRMLRAINNVDDMSRSIEEMNSRLEKVNDFDEIVDKTLDTSGENCPMPIIKTKKVLKELEIGQTMKLISTDPGAVGDIQSLCDSLKQGLEKTIEEDNKFIFIIRKTTEI